MTNSLIPPPPPATETPGDKTGNTNGEELSKAVEEASEGRREI